MIPISIATLIRSFGFNGADFLGFKISPSGKGRKKHNIRYQGLTIKSFSGEEFHTGNTWHEADEFSLGEFRIEQLDKIIDVLKKMTDEYKGIRQHLTERGETVYDLETIGVDKVIALAKKSDPKEAKRLFMELLQGAPL